ncbi:MAG: DEAD/DEAH box helicase [Bacilli bacterium]
MFKKYKFKPFINEALIDLGFREPTNVQKEVIPKVLNNENVIAQSQTGTGKTHAFLLPLLNNLDNVEEVQYVIIVPTRELAYQISDEINKIIKFSNSLIDVRTYVGGTNRESEIERLKISQPQIVIGTIGKVKDLAISTNLLKIHTAKAVVVDEADMVFESSEIEDIDTIFARFVDDIQVLVFSATVFNDLIVFLNKYLSKFELVDLTNKNIAHENIKHIFIPTKNKNKFTLLVNLLNTFHPYLVLIFANTKTTVDDIANHLGENGFKVGKLTGDLEARERKQILRRIKDADFQYVVASDIASRGIDITGVSHVINFELPNDIEFFIHRTGRTGRIDNDGISISFYDYEDDSYINKLEAKGLSCTYMALKNNELVPTKERNARSKRVNKMTTLEESIHRAIPVPKKVKPGYKKKRNEKIQKELRKAKRNKIEDIYRRKARKEE